MWKINISARTPMCLCTLRVRVCTLCVHVCVRECASAQAKFN